MDPHCHVAALREVRLVPSVAQSALGVCTGAVTCHGKESVQRPNRQPDRRVSGDRTSDRDCSGCGRCDQASAHRDADHRRARAAPENRAGQRRIRLYKQHDQKIELIS